MRILERRGGDGPFGAMWGWRKAVEGSGRNGLEEGERGARVLKKQSMASPADWRWAAPEERSKL